MPQIRLGCIVEGHGEQESARILVRRVALELGLPQPEVVAWRSKRHLIVRADELERSLTFLRNKLGVQGRVLVLLDSDDDCPAELGPELLERATKATDLRVGVVLANRECESWFLAAAPSLQALGVLRSDAVPPADPESVRGAKEWLATAGLDYSPTLHQASLTEQFSLVEARRAQSFGKLVREVQALLT